MSKVHELKTLESNFKDVVTSKMTFQLRKSDRDFTIGDILVLKEFDGQYLTGNIQVAKVNNTLSHDEGIREGFVLLNIKLLSGYVEKGGMRWMTKNGYNRSR